MPTIAIAGRTCLLFPLMSDVNITPQVNIGYILRKYNWARLIKMTIGYAISIIKQQMLSVV